MPPTPRALPGLPGPLGAGLEWKQSPHGPLGLFWGGIGMEKAPHGPLGPWRRIGMVAQATPFPGLSALEKRKSDKKKTFSTPASSGQNEHVSTTMFCPGLQALEKRTSDNKYTFQACRHWKNEHVSKERCVQSCRHKKNETVSKRNAFFRNTDPKL